MTDGRRTWFWLGIVSSLFIAAAWSCATETSMETSLGDGSLNRTALRATQAHTVAAARLPSPVFETQTATGRTLGVVGVLAGAAIEGIHAPQITGTGLEDPAIAIRAALVGRLSRRFRLDVIPDPESEEVEGAPFRPDLTLSIETSVWGIMPTRLGHYAVKYRGSLRLTDNRSHQTIAEGECVSLPVDDDGVPSYDQLVADDSSLLKSALKSVTEYCIDDYRKRLLGLY